MNDVPPLQFWPRWPTGQRRAKALACAQLALANTWTTPCLAAALSRELPREQAHHLALRLIDACPSPVLATPRRLADLILELPWLPRHPSTEPSPGTRLELSRVLELDEGELAWFADRQQRNLTADSRLRHYRTWRAGGRLIEAPKPRLAEIQRRLDRHILATLPVHPSAHGFRRGRNVYTFTRAHTAKAIVIRTDLRCFFPSITATRIKGLLRANGFQDSFAAVTSALLTTTTPSRARSELTDWFVRARYAQRHLPQGAPSSPAVANAICLRLDTRLSALAESFGGIYTRYADDLAFSFPTVGAQPFLRLVRDVVREEGFSLHDKKTAVQRAHRRQQLASLVVNSDPAPSRADYDELRAILYNSIRYGPDSQNHSAHPEFRTHLLGRIHWIAGDRTHRHAKLMCLFNRIEW